jgi:hypothetical protein
MQSFKVVIPAQAETDSRISGIDREIPVGTVMTVGCRFVRQINKP